MIPSDFEGSNRVFGPPKTWDEKVQGVCLPLPVLVEEDPHNPGNHFVVSKWMPSEADLKAINDGQGIYLQCWGGMPPVCLWTIDKDGTNNVESLIVLPKEES